MAEIKNALTVTELNEIIKRIIDSESFLSNLYIKGEISNFVNHRTGHFYFSLKDESSLIKTVMFSSSASKLKFVPENGMKVIVHGRVAAFTRDGTYNFYCDSMEPDGVGALYIAYEQLKRKLASEGLFDEYRKKPLPKVPTRIGVITSPTGAAVRDIINIVTRRFRYAKIILYPSLVQGEGAPAQLIAGLDYFNKTSSADVIIIGRGGGSIEDLWAFNDEALARRIASSEIPVISAVGHETDFTISDFVSDRRAPTPSAAAEIAVPDTEEIIRKVNNITGRMQILLSKSIKERELRLRYLSERKVMTNPLFILDEKKTELLNLSMKLDSAISKTYSDKKSEFSIVATKLGALNPLSVLSRGFSAVFDEEGNLVKSVKNTNVGDKINLKLADGIIRTTVDSKENGEKING